MKLLDKNKPKELDWKKELDILFSNKVLLGYEQPTISLKEFIKQTLTQQRTELLEEIKNYFRYKRFGCTDESGKIMADFVLDVVKQEVINLLNKKDE